VAILARTDFRTADLKVSNAQAGNFLVNCGLPTALFGPVTVRRGWVAVDVKIRGSSFRLVNTHLDGDCLPFTPAFQRAQAQELLAGPASTDLPLLLMGDLNSPADGTGVTYNDLLAAGFSDAWSEVGAGVGLTCCQDAKLLNPLSALYTRIDVVLFRGPLSPLGAHIVGDDPAARTPSGLWPSDHAGVAAVMRLTK
jgi:endonuclease/exonuclease/phosphatase family metal-dependent hydrolase